MRKKLTKIAALVLAATMVFGLTACGDGGNGGKKGKGANAYTVIKDKKTGKAVDLGGITITIRDWWSDPEGNLAEPRDEYEEARQEYRDWLQSTYNFTMKVQGIGDWGSVPQDFVDYVQNGGDDNNYCFVLRWSSPVLQAMYSGMCYDLATLDCLDFSETKYQINQAHAKGSIGDHIYAFAGGYVEPKGGIYFNKQVLKDAGIEPDQIYDWQKNGEWTWDKLDEVCAKVHRDTDGDGVVDVYGVTANEGEMFQFFLASNGGALVKKDGSGKFVYALEDADTMEAFEWIVNFWSKYDNHDPEGAQWDYFKEEFLSGNVAFLPEQEYAGTGTNYLTEAQFECGFVMYPKGPKAQNYSSVFDDNPYMIPGCYDADKAWKIAFAVDQWFNQPAGYEDFNARLSDARNGIFDERAVTETIAYMTDPKNATILYSSIIPTLCDSAMEDLGWPGWYTVPSTAAETVRDTWKAYIADANK
ncbi:MAG: extracellular solute-binding protein [Lachnospiraceae bacterium]|nr:extracellular solute-binding protein [Lachnospiraceae bacterium]